MTKKFDTMLIEVCPGTGFVVSLIDSSQGSAPMQRKPDHAFTNESDMLAALPNILEGKK